MATRKKRIARKGADDQVWSDATWRVVFGELSRGKGNPGATRPLFKVVAEKLPFEALADVRSDLQKRGILRKGATPTGVYVAHDSMGVARYVGRGRIFGRLRRRYKAQTLELKYFSFYVGLEKAHEREVETILIRSAGPQLHFNTRKKRVDIEAGNVRDYEPGTWFYQRQYLRGRKPKRRRRA